MDNQNTNEIPNQGKSIDNLKSDSVNGEEILGGGKVTNAGSGPVTTIKNDDIITISLDNVPGNQPPSYEVEDVSQAIGPDIFTV